jgi:hypothetical protein
VPGLLAARLLLLNWQFLDHRPPYTAAAAPRAAQRPCQVACLGLPQEGLQLLPRQANALAIAAAAR